MHRNCFCSHCSRNSIMTSNTNGSFQTVLNFTADCECSMIYTSRCAMCSPRRTCIYERATRSICFVTITGSQCKGSGMVKCTYCTNTILSAKFVQVLCLSLTMDTLARITLKHNVHRNDSKIQYLSNNTMSRLCDNTFLQQLVIALSTSYAYISLPLSM